MVDPKCLSCIVILLDLGSDALDFGIVGVHFRLKDDAFEFWPDTGFRIWFLSITAGETPVIHRAYCWLFERSGELTAM